jgi:hypothetical protein
MKWIQVSAIAMRYIQKKDRKAPKFFPTFKVIRDKNDIKQVYGKRRYDLTTLVYETLKYDKEIDLHSLLKKSYKKIMSNKKKTVRFKRIMADESKTAESVTLTSSKDIDTDEIVKKIEELKKTIDTLNTTVTEIKTKIFEPKNVVEIRHNERDGIIDVIKPYSAQTQTRIGNLYNPSYYYPYHVPTTYTPMQTLPYQTNVNNNNAVPITTTNINNTNNNNNTTTTASEQSYTLPLNMHQQRLEIGPPPFFSNFNPKFTNNFLSRSQQWFNNKNGRRRGRGRSRGFGLGRQIRRNDDDDDVFNNFFGSF